MSQKNNLLDNLQYRCVSIIVVLTLCVSVLGGCGREQAPSETGRVSTSSGFRKQQESQSGKSVVPEMLDAPISRDSPADSDSILAGPSNNSIATARGGLVNIDSATPEQLREATLRALGQGQDDTAFALVRQVMRVDPGHPQTVFMHALVLGARHRFDEAIKILDDLAAQAPATRLPVLGQTAEWMVRAGKFDEAEARYRSILDEVPDSSMVHRHLGRLQMQLGKRTDAALHFRYLAQLGELDQEELRALLALSTPLPQGAVSGRLEPMNQLARARKEMALTRLSEALEIIESEGALSEAEASLRARIHAAQNDFDAVGQWAASHKPSVNDSDGCFAMGSLAASEQDHSEAIRWFSKTLLIDQTDAEAYQMLSQSLRAVGDGATADRASKRAELIRQTREIGAQLTIDKSEDRACIAKLVVLLQQLKRPLEVLGWQSVDLVYAVNEAKMTEPEAGAVFEEIGRKREQLVKSGACKMDPSFILCGLTIDR